MRASAAFALLLGGTVSTFTVPDEASLPHDDWGETVRYGKQLVADTQHQAPAYVGNRLNCASCHLDAGTTPNAGPYVGVYGTFPQYRSRSGRVDILEDRINDCFRRSLNGKPLPPDSREMRAMVAYMAWLSSGVPVGQRVPGQGMPKLQPAHPPDLKKGGQVFSQKCASCHGPNGQGLGNNPPLWGDHSFNIGAGMARLSNAAGFIKQNMPRGNGGTLTDEEAVNVAAFMLSHPRPDFPDKVKDWPKGDKPKDSPY